MKKIPPRKAENKKNVYRDIRVVVLSLAIFLVAALVVFRLYSLQVGAYDQYRGMAERQHTISQFLQARRGEIYLEDRDADRGLYPIAVNREYPMVYIAPNRVKDANTVVSLLSSVLGKDRSEIESKLIDRNDPFELVAHRISPEQKEAIETAKVEGVAVSPEEFRYYPGETLASQMIGFVGSDGERLLGRYGLEASFERVLGGTSGMMSGSRDAGGRRMMQEESTFQAPEDGSDIVLSIQHTMQYTAEQLIKEAVEKNEADSGSLMAMDPQTGKILAMASYPNFNPNEYSKVEDLSLFMNAPVQSLYESGSVFKPFTLAMGIDQGVITPQSTYTDTGILHAGSSTIQNSDKKSNGVQTMTQVLEKSLNTGTVYVEKLLGNKAFAEYIRRFGFGETTGSGFIGEVSGNIKNLDYLNRDINFYTASFGQGISMTLLQLARGYSALANGGRLMQSQFVDRIIHTDGTVEVIEPREDRRVIQESTAKQMGEMLYSVVEEGHGKAAKIAGYRVGGKTGTAQVVKQGTSGYAEGINIGTFAGYAPIDNPKFVVVAKIDNPKGVVWAETSAAPVFQKMMSFLLSYEKIPPTEEGQLQQKK